MASLVRLVAVVVLATAMVALMFDGQRDGDDVISLSREGLLAGDPGAAARSAGEPVEPGVFAPWEAPPIPDVPEAWFEPLEFTVFEPPYDGQPIPADVLARARAETRALWGEVVAAGGEPARSARDRDPSWYERGLEVAEWGHGVQVWIHRFQDPTYLMRSLDTLELVDSSTGRRSPGHVVLATRWGGMTNLELGGRVFRGDLDGDGRLELVLHEYEHNGTAVNEDALHWYTVGDDLAPEPLISHAAASFVDMMGWDGLLRSRLLPVGADEVWVESWYEPRLEGELTSLGHTVMRRGGPGQPFEVDYVVADPAEARPGAVGFGLEPAGFGRPDGFEIGWEPR